MLPDDHVASTSTSTADDLERRPHRSSRRDVDHQTMFFKTLRQALANYTTLSFLEAADIAAEFNHSVSHPAQEFTSDAVRWLKELERIDSAAVHYAVRQRTQRLGAIRAPTDAPLRSLIPTNDLERYAYDLAELLDRVNILRPSGDESGWLEDRGVQRGLVMTSISSQIAF